MTEHRLTEARELMLRYQVAQAGYPGRYPVEVNPLVYGMPQAQSWLIAHGYLDAMLRPTSKGLEAALELGSDHRPRVERTETCRDDTQEVGTRVRCSCGWGGWREDPPEITVPLPPAEGGRTKVLQIHAEHANAA